MCWFVAVGLSESGVQALEALGRERDAVGVHRCASPSIAALFRPTRGWSEAKIARALEARKEARAIAQQIKTQGSVRLFAHEYRGAPDGEPVASEGRVRLSLEEYLRGDGAFPTDMLVEITRS